MCLYKVRDLCTAFNFFKKPKIVQKLTYKQRDKVSFLIVSQMSKDRVQRSSFLSFTCQEKGTLQTIRLVRRA